jgi:hypothetical protein
LTKAMAILKIPKTMVYRGMAFPGPNHLVNRFAGSSKTTATERMSLKHGMNNVLTSRLTDIADIED